MDAKTAEHKKNCKMCNRKGLPLLLTRYAIAPKISKAPEMKDDGVFKVTKDGTSFVPLDSDTIYTQRLLRAGYVYVYDPIRKTVDGRPNPWQGYAVNVKGYLTPFRVDDDLRYIPKIANEDIPCDPWVSGMLARCISVETPEKSRTIWIGFSDTLWTKNVLDEHENKATRDRHMRSFNPKTWWDSEKHNHTCRLEECDKYVVEMAAGVKRQTFEFSPAPLYSLPTVYDWKTLAERADAKPDDSVSADKRQKEALQKQYAEKYAKAATEMLANPSTPKDSLLRASERLLGEKNKHKVAVVALNDPVGILMDLAVYTDYSYGNYYEKVLMKEYEEEKGMTYKRCLAIAGIIESIEAGIRNGTKEYWKERARRKVSYASKAAHSASYAEKGWAQNTLGNPELLKKSADARWEKYATRFDKKKIDAARNAFEVDLNAFFEKHIRPLVKGYVEWFKSDYFVASMECNHDTDNMDSGVSYATITSLCLGCMQDKALVNEEIIMKQLEASALDKNQVLSRALVLNQDSDAKNIQAAVDKGKGMKSDELIDQMEFWKEVIKLSDEAVKRFEKNTDLVNARDSILGTLTAQVGGCILRAAQLVATAGPMIPAILVKLGYVAHIPIVKVKVEGNFFAIAQYLTEMYIKALPGNKADLMATITQSLEDKLRKAGQTQTNFNAYIAINEEKFSSALKSSGNQRAIMGSMTIAIDRTRGLLQNQQLVMRLNNQPVDGLVYQHADLKMLAQFDAGRINESIHKLPAAASIVVGLLQICVFMKAGDEVDEVIAAGIATGDEAKVDEVRFSYKAAAFFGMLYAAGEAMEGLEKLRPGLVKLSPALFGKIKFGAKFFGILGAGVFVYLDVKNAYKSVQNDEFGMTALYAISGLTNIGGGTLIFLSMLSPRIVTAAWFPVAGISLLVAGIVISLAIAIFEDDDLENWLGHCVFGTKADKFPSLEKELSELEKLLSKSSR